MIEKLLATDFQLHHKRLVVFDKDITVFTGQTEAGKSALLRCLWWVLTNQPSGTEMIGGWGKAKFAQGKLWLDSHKVTRRRSTTFNGYRLGDGPWLKAFGLAGVPQAVQDLANVDEVNFQSQIDPPFWFTLPAPEVSRRLNSIVNLDEIDRVLGNAARNARSTKAAVAVSQDRLKAAKQKKKELAWARELDAQVHGLEGLEAERTELTSTIATIGALTEGLAQADQRADDCARAVTAAQETVQLAEESIGLEAEIAELGELTEGLRSSDRRLKTPVPDLARLTRLRSKASRVAEDRQRLANFCLWLSEAEYEIGHYDEELQRCRRKLKKAGVVTCPTCKQPVDVSQSASQTLTSATKSQSPEQKPEKSGTRPSRGTLTSFERLLTNGFPSSAQGTSATPGTSRRSS